MKNVLLVVAFLTCSLLAVPTSMADNIGDFKLQGQVFSAGATIPAGESSVLLTQVPKARQLVVTQFCRSDFSSAELSGTQLGRVPAEQSGNCTNYILGVVFKNGESIFCSIKFGPAFEDIPCLINGVMSAADH